MNTTLTRLVGTALASAALLGTAAVPPAAGAQDLGSLSAVAGSVDTLAALTTHLGATPGPAVPAPTHPAPRPNLEQQRDRIEAELQRLIVQTRRDHGVPSGSWSTALARDSRAWSEEIVRNGVRHDRMAPGMGENIHGTTADHTRVARSAITGWLNSPGHRAILLNPDTRNYGAGVARNTATGWWYVTYRMTV